MIKANQIKVYSTSTQGLLAVYVDHYPDSQKVDHRWRVSNNGGKWCAYAKLADGSTLRCNKDLARHIHRDSLAEQLADIMNAYTDEVAADAVEPRGGAS